MNNFKDALKKIKIKDKEEVVLSKDLEIEKKEVNKIDKFKNWCRNIFSKKKCKKILIINTRGFTAYEIEKAILEQKDIHTLYFLRRKVKEDKQEKEKKEKQLKLLKKKFSKKMTVYNRATSQLNKDIEKIKYIHGKEYDFIVINKINNSTIENKETNIIKKVDLPKFKTKIKEGSNLILWDIENISFKYIDLIFSQLDVIDKLYIVSVNPVSEKNIRKINNFFKEFNIEIITGHEDSDQEIKDIIMEKYTIYDKTTIISSDTDFVNTIKFILDKGKEVKVIAREVQKKGMIMRNKLDHPNLKIVTV